MLDRAKEHMRKNKSAYNVVFLMIVIFSVAITADFVYLWKIDTKFQTDFKSYDDQFEKKGIRFP